MARPGNRATREGVCIQPFRCCLRAARVQPGVQSEAVLSAGHRCGRNAVLSRRARLYALLAAMVEVRWWTLRWALAVALAAGRSEAREATGCAEGDVPRRGLRRYSATRLPAIAPARYRERNGRCQPGGAAGRLPHGPNATTRPAERCAHRPCQSEPEHSEHGPLAQLVPPTRCVPRACSSTRPGR